MPSDDRRRARLSDPYRDATASGLDFDLVARPYSDQGAVSETPRLADDQEGEVRRALRTVALPWWLIPELRCHSNSCQVVLFQPAGAA